MPFTIDIPPAIKDNFHGQLIIDRSNLIFLFPAKNLDLKSQNKCAELTTILQSFFYQHDIMDGLRVNTKTLDPDSQEHRVKDHLSNYDKQGFHFHLRLDQNIDFLTLEKIFHRMESASKKDNSINKVITPADRAGILATARQYFIELKESPEAAYNEQEHRKTKEIEVRNASIEDKKRAASGEAEEKEVDLDFDRLIQIISNDMAEMSNLLEFLSDETPAPSKSKEKLRKQSDPNDKGFYGLFGAAVKKQKEVEAQDTKNPKQLKQESKKQKETGLFAEMARNLRARKKAGDTKKPSHVELNGSVGTEHKEQETGLYAEMSRNLKARRFKGK